LILFDAVSLTPPGPALFLLSLLSLFKTRCLALRFNSPQFSYISIDLALWLSYPTRTFSIGAQSLFALILLEQLVTLSYAFGLEMILLSRPDRVVSKSHFRNPVVACLQRGELLRSGSQFFLSRSFFWSSFRLAMCHRCPRPPRNRPLTHILDRTHQKLRSQVPHGARHLWAFWRPGCF